MRDRTIICGLNAHAVRAVGPSLLLGLSLCASAALADPLEPAFTPLRGRYDFVFVGASLADSQGLSNGVNCLKSTATANVAPEEIPSSRARLVAARLYVSGSLLDDGIDFAATGEAIFSNDGRSYENPDEQQAIRDQALLEADTRVMFQPPGAVAPIEVSAPAFAPRLAIRYESGLQPGNVAFFMTPIDVTDIVRGVGRGTLPGDYTVSGLRADLCYGAEALCEDPPNPPICDTESEAHSKGAASFGILLVFEDPSLPLATIGVFEGLELLPAGGSVTIGLQTGSPISPPGAGSLAFYALEGDLSFGVPQPVGTSAPCDADEYIEVDGDLIPSVDGLCLEDDDNPRGNIFNSTINVQKPDPAPTPPAGCSDPSVAHFLCCGDGLCGETGVDIDEFDISDALEPGANQVRVRLGTNGDTLAMGVVALSAGIFEPVLDVDSQIRILTELDGAVQIGGFLDYSIAISNTGNVDATGVRVFMDAPAFTEAFEVLRIPRNATDLSVVQGGLYNTGLLRVEDIFVPRGEIAEVRLRLRVRCESLSRTISATAQIAADGLQPFDLEAPDVVGRGPPAPGTEECPDVDPGGPFGGGFILAERKLRGGGGCANTQASWLLALLAGLVLLVHTRRVRRIEMLVAAACLAVIACAEKRKPPGGPDPEPSKRLTSLFGLPGTDCGADPTMAVVRHRDGTTFCIDRIEATLDGASLGNAHQGGGDDEVFSTDGSTVAKARIELGDFPAVEVSWYQAVAACENAGKRLCTRAEWERACRGPTELLYPYGDNIVDDACNGFFNYAEINPAVTGSLNTCGSHWGVYDLSGNIEEWVFDGAPRQPDRTTLEDRYVRGGSYRSNTNALACVGDEFHEPPDSVDNDRGFRCCMNAP